MHTALASTLIDSLLITMMIAAITRLAAERLLPCRTTRLSPLSRPLNRP